MPRERSFWALGALVTACVLLSLSLFLPWYAFHHSTGTTAPPRTESEDDGVTRRDIYYAPFDTRGDASAEQQEDASAATLVLGALVTAATTLSLLALFLEAVWATHEGLRRLQLVLLAAAGVFAASAAAFTWLAFPALLASEGVTSLFTTRNDQGTFIRSTLSFGWTFGALSIIAQAAAFGFKYAGGVFNVGLLDQYRTDPR
jgi:hypothetical protein